jgi:hypothetical protein
MAMPTVEEALRRFAERFSEVLALEVRRVNIDGDRFLCVLERGGDPHVGWFVAEHPEDPGMVLWWFPDESVPQTLADFVIKTIEDGVGPLVPHPITGEIEDRFSRRDVRDWLLGRVCEEAVG